MTFFNRNRLIKKLYTIFKAHKLKLKITALLILTIIKITITDPQQLKRTPHYLNLLHPFSCFLYFSNKNLKIPVMKAFI
jgi:hypothetical protein